MSLRVITGLRKGHKLKGPRSGDARPTEDRVKESIFNIIEPLEDDAVCLDLFACTGNIGIEFLSRGVKKVYFSELEKKNVEDLEWNLNHTKFTKQSEIFTGDFRRNLLGIRENIDYVYLDPPYASSFYEESFNFMLGNKYFKHALYITEMNVDENFSNKFKTLELVYEKQYGKKYIKFYREYE